MYMTFTTTNNGLVSENNSTSATLGASGTFTGTGENIEQYDSVEVFATSDVDSDPSGVEIQFSTDNTNWDIIRRFTYASRNNFLEVKVNAINKFCRVVYNNGTSGQSTFRLQTRFHLNPQNQVSFPISTTDAFGRIRISNPFTLLEFNFVTDINIKLVDTLSTGLSTVTHNTNSSSITLATTGSGNSKVESRTRGIYQPGKSLLFLVTGVLNNGTNPASVETKLGYFDDDDGVWFQYENSIVSVVKRSSISGSIVETKVDQTDWNINPLSSGSGSKFTLDVSKTLIYYADFEWLGVGSITMGVIIDKELIPIHRFDHSNIETLPYIKTASLPIRGEITSTSGSGNMLMICGTAISEGGYNPIGKVFSVNRGISLQSIGTTPEPLICIRIKDANPWPKVSVRIIGVSAISTTGANALIELYKFDNVDETTALTGESFTSAGTDSAVEYDISATDITLTSGQLIFSEYFSNDSDQLNFNNIDTARINHTLGTSSWIALVARTITATESFLGSLTWKEFI